VIAGFRTSIPAIMIARAALSRSMLHPARLQHFFFHF
jgi:hypothetical protein